MAVYLTNSTELSSIANAIRKKAKTNNPIEYPNGFVNAIKDIQTSNMKNVIFYDYDGSIVESYNADDFLELTNMPANPSHTGLIAQGWNWSLSDAKTYVTKYGSLNIGQMYITESGATEIDVVMQKGRLEPILTIVVDGTITVDWGDNTTPDTVTGTSLYIRQEVPHTYAQAGSYTISISATGDNKYGLYGTTQYTLLRKNTTESENKVYTNTVQQIRIGSNVEIMSSSFYNCYSLKSITIPNNITSIGTSTFQACYSLSSVTIPNNVTSIGQSAFQACYSLTNVAIPYSVTSIENSAFHSCYSLASITIPDDVTSIGSQVFASCNSLARVVLPDDVTSIGQQAFSNCRSLASITIPDGVTSIENSTFNSCYTLSSILIPDNVTSIGQKAFQYCYSLNSILIPNSVTSIGSQAFHYCHSLTSVIIPNSVTSIESLAFRYCQALVSITIPDSVTSIGDSAFYNCYGIKEYHILPTTLPTAGTTIFNGIPSDCIIYVPKGHLTEYQTATNWSTYASYMQEEPT